MTTTKKRIGRPTTTDPRVHRYNFKLTTEENIRFKQMLCEAGLEHNRSRFIIKRLFGEEFVVVRRDPSKVQFVARLNDFYFQFQKLANNYNQVVKAINSHFSNVAIPHQVRTIGAADERIKSPQYRDSEPCKTSCGMVANIRSGPSPNGALYYNKEKVDKDKAEVLFGQKMLELFDKYGQWMLYLD